MAPPPYPPFATILGKVARRYIEVRNLTLAITVNEFAQNEGSFGSAVCTAMKHVCQTKEDEAEASGVEPDPCDDCRGSDVEILSVRAGSTKVDFIIHHRPGGPTTPVLRRFFLDWRGLFLAELAEEGFPFDADAPPPQTITVIMGGLSAGALNSELVGEALAGATNVFFSLDGVWAIVLMWSLTTRGDSCQSKTKRSRLAKLLPSSETLQIMCLAIFFQLVCALIMHKYIAYQESMVFVVMVGILVGACGMLFVYALNSWIRGTTFSLKGLDEIDVTGVTYINYEKNEDYYETKVYSRPYEAGMKGKRALGQLAGHDWEGAHMQWEKAQGLIDLSDEIFDEQMEPEHDKGLVAQFLNSSLLSAFGGGKKSMHAQQAVDPNFQAVKVEVHKPISRHLRDALMQWRLRHTAHPVEAEAAAAVLGQLDPNFRVLAVEVPQQARMMLVQAIVQWTQKHPHMQLDAGHATRIQMLLEQIAPRFDGMSLPLPLDDASTTNMTRDLLTDALTAKLTNTSKKDLTQEDGLMLQHMLQQLAPAYALITMETVVPENLSEDNQEALEIDVRDEIERLAQYAEAIDDDDLYTPVPLIVHTEPPEVVEMGRPGAGRNASPQKSRNASPQKSGNRRPAPSLPPSPPSSPPGETAWPSAGASTAKPSPASPSRRFRPKAQRVSATWTDPACVSSTAASVVQATCAPGDGIRRRAVLLSGAELGDEQIASPPPSPPAREAPIAEEEEEEEEAPSLVETLQLNVEASQTDVEVSLQSQTSAEASQSSVAESSAEASQWSAAESSAEASQWSVAESSVGASQPLTCDLVASIPGGKEIGGASKPSRWAGSNTSADENAAKTAVLNARKKAFFQRRRKKEQKMPCWKQYTMLFIGTILVVIANSLAIGWMATMEPLQAAVSMISWAIGWPCSFIFHITTRTIMRHLRKKRALKRGRMVKGSLKEIYMNDPALGGRPSLQVTQRMSAAGGLVARWDMYGQNPGEDEDEEKPKPKKGGLGAGLKGMCTKRISAGYSSCSSASSTGRPMPPISPVNREKGSGGMRDKDILKAASRPKGNDKKKLNTRSQGEGFNSSISSERSAGREGGRGLYTIASGLEDASSNTTGDQSQREDPGDGAVRV